MTFTIVEGSILAYFLVCLALGAWLIYLNNVTMPTRLHDAYEIPGRSADLDGLEELERGEGGED